MDIDRIFTYHPPHGTQATRYEHIRLHARSTARAINELCPESAEKTLALRALQQSVMWASASIAINEVFEPPTPTGYEDWWPSKPNARAVPYSESSVDKIRLPDGQEIEAIGPRADKPNPGTVSLPRYRSHKIVEAAKILSIVDVVADAVCDVQLTLDLGHRRIGFHAVSGKWIGKHDAYVGGYFVRDADGYESFSPAWAFEEGYTPIEAEAAQQEAKQARERTPKEALAARIARVVTDIVNDAGDFCVGK